MERACRDARTAEKGAKMHTHMHRKRKVKLELESKSRKRAKFNVLANR